MMQRHAKLRAWHAMRNSRLMHQALCVAGQTIPRMSLLRSTELSTKPAERRMTTAGLAMVCREGVHLPLTSRIVSQSLALGAPQRGIWMDRQQREQRQQWGDGEREEEIGRRSRQGWVREQGGSDTARRRHITPDTKNVAVEYTCNTILIVIAMCPSEPSTR